MHKNDEPKRILVISDSLGTPIHARGIFNFTCSAVQIFNKLGFETCLLVEPPDAGAILQIKPREPKRSTSRGTPFALISDIIKHFEGDRFRFSWTYPDSSLQRFSSEVTDSANFRLALLDTTRVSHQLRIPLQRDFHKEYEFSMNSEHLKLFSEFLLVKNVYSESFRRAALDLRPVSIDASEFDFVYIDTPHFIVPHGIDPRKVFCVFHDFIPFFDKFMGFDWRQLFIRKMECSTRVTDNLIFNSETTKRYFQRIYQADWGGRQFVVYPPNRVEVEYAASGADRRQPSNYMRDIQDNKVKEQAEWAIKIKEKTIDERRRSELQKRAKWIPGLPFFCSVLSDEPRKNIAALVRASKEFVGRANFVVMGQINGNRYMLDSPEDFPNLHFTGYVSDEQKFDLLRSCTGFIFPSLMEGFGIPIVEAAMFGAPVICSDTEVFREITFEKSLYFPANQEHILIKHIESLLSKPNCDGLGLELQKLSQASYSQEAMIKKMSLLFELEGVA